MSRSPEPKAADLRLQLLGLAFAGADLVFEIGPDGVISFCLGAAEQLTGRGAEALMGASWAELVSEADADLLAAILGGLKPGERQGPLAVVLRAKGAGGAERRASLSAFRLPQREGQVSCALSLGAPAAMEAFATPAGGFVDQETFSAASSILLQEAERAGLPVRLDLIELDGLNASMRAMATGEADLVRRRIAATLRADSIGGLGASEVATDRFALVRTATASSEDLADSLQQAAGPAVIQTSAALPLSAASAAQNLRAMRYALDRYIEDGPKAAEASFLAAVKRTVQETDRFKAMMASGAFHLAYQPVVDLETATLHHFEALARFDAQSSPADTIKLAEELRLIADFDLVVVNTVAKVLAGAPEARIAANVSAVSLMQPGFLEALLKLTEADPGLRRRLLFEVTETQILDDLGEANARLQALRRAGHAVCLDDFGAGAASLDYLRFLDVDIVKIDGRYIQTLDKRVRDALLLKHIVALCEDLHVATIAEMVETSATAKLAQSLGVKLGQGWFFGKPSPEPKWTDPAAKPVRRVGAVESWG